MKKNLNQIILLLASALFILSSASCATVGGSAKTCKAQVITLGMPLTRAKA